jgi:micrococcal nuclease
MRRSRDVLPPAAAIALPHDALLFVNLEAAQLEMRDHLGGKRLSGIVGDVLRQDAPHQGAVLLDGKAYRESKLLSEGIHGPSFSFRSRHAGRIGGQRGCGRLPTRHGDRRGDVHPRGDTIELGALAIRLNGLAAPEWNEPGGAEASDAMRDLVLGKEVVCALDGDRTYDRCVAICTLDGADIAEEMVRQGLARDCPRFSGGRYEAVEMQAGWQGATIRDTYRLPTYCVKR